MAGCFPENNVLLQTITRLETEQQFHFHIERSRFYWQLAIYQEGLENIPGNEDLEVWIVNSNTERMRTHSDVQNGNVELGQNESVIVWKGSLASLKMRGIPIQLSPILPSSPYGAKNITLVIKSNRPLDLAPGKLEIFKTYADGF